MGDYIDLDHPKVLDDLSDVPRVRIGVVGRSDEIYSPTTLFQYLHGGSESVSCQC
jgi:hypothetical protein